MQNDIVESFNGLQRHKCSNGTLFTALIHARFVLTA